MDYQANVDGMVWFCREVWPGLKSAFPGLKCTIVGANPPQKVRRLEGDGIAVTGYVDDVRDYYRLADIGIIPLRMARGVQNKALEAMAMGLPVVATSRVIQGIGATPERDLLPGDTADEFRDQVTRLIRNRRLAEELGARGREFVLRHFDWRANLADLHRVLQSTSPRPRRPNRPERGVLSPLFLLFVLGFMLMTSLWPMETTSPGATLLYRIDPNLQNFLHLPMLMIFAFVFLDFLHHHDLEPKFRWVWLAAGGSGVCLVLEGLQSFVPGRYPSVTDMLVNLCGLAVGSGLYQVLKRIRRKPSGQ